MPESKKSAKVVSRLEGKIIGDRPRGLGMRGTINFLIQFEAYEKLYIWKFLLRERETERKGEKDK